jgi:hypothetical protein
VTVRYWRKNRGKIGVEDTRDWRHRAACVAPIGRMEMRYGKAHEKLLDGCRVDAPTDWKRRCRRAR